MYYFLVLPIKIYYKFFTTDLQPNLTPKCFSQIICSLLLRLAIETVVASRYLPDQLGASRIPRMSTGCGLTDVGQISRASPITRRQVLYTSISVKSATKCPIGTLSSSLPVLLSVCLTHNIYCYSFLLVLFKERDFISEDVFFNDSVQKFDETVKVFVR